MLRDRNFIIIDSNTSSAELKRLDFLNLEYKEKLENNNITSLDYYSFTCRFKNKFKHSLHTNNIHLNGITDLIINLGLNLEKESKYSHNTLEKLERLVNYTYKKTELISKLTENLGYLKEQNNQIIKELKEIRKFIPSKQEIQQLSYLLENNKPKQIETENKNLLNKVENQVTNLEELLNTVKKIVEG